MEGNGTPLQCSCLENPMDGGAWWAAVHGVATERLHFHFSLFTFHALEKEMATYSSVLAWRIPGTGRPAVYGVARSRTRLKQLSSMAISFPPNVLPSITSAHQTSFHLKACGHVFFPLPFAL